MLKLPFNKREIILHNSIVILEITFLLSIHIFVIRISLWQLTTETSWQMDQIYITLSSNKVVVLVLLLLINRKYLSASKRKNLGVNHAKTALVHFTRRRLDGLRAPTLYLFFNYWQFFRSCLFLDVLFLLQYDCHLRKLHKNLYFLLIYLQYSLISFQLVTVFISLTFYISVYVCIL